MPASSTSSATCCSSSSSAMRYEERVGKNKFVAIYFIAGVAAHWSEAFVAARRQPVERADRRFRRHRRCRWGRCSCSIHATRCPMFLLIIFLPAVSVWLAVGSWFAWQVFLAFSTPNALVGGGIGVRGPLRRFPGRHAGGASIPAIDGQDRRRAVRCHRPGIAGHHERA